MSESIETNVVMVATVSASQNNAARFSRLSKLGQRNRDVAWLLETYLAVVEENRKAKAEPQQKPKKGSA